MSKFIVFSDIHGNYNALQKLKPLINENDGAFFAGDGLKDLLGLRVANLHYVSGNCDGFGECEKIVEVEDVKIFLTHGHEYGVKGDLQRLYYRASELGANVVIFGHTHQPLIQEINGILFLNPGSCSVFSVPQTFIYLCVQGTKASAFLNKTTLNGV